MFERLSASPATYRTSSSSVAAVATAVVVLAGGVAALALFATGMFGMLGTWIS